MPRILPASQKIFNKVQRYGLTKKFEKQLNFLKQNPHHPSLNVELLKPKQHKIYSFRIDRKYRALFIFRDDKNAIEILNITKHYE